MQKMIHLLQLGGANVGTHFKLSDYGPYSRELAQWADILTVTGKIEKEVEPTGVYDTYQSVYTLPDQSKRVPKWPKKYSELLSSLDRYSTIELEIASTIGYFIRGGYSEEKAVEKTRYQKPTKAIRPVVNKARSILELISVES